MGRPRRAAHQGAYRLPRRGDKRDENRIGQSPQNETEGKIPVAQSPRRQTGTGAKNFRNGESYYFGELATPFRTGAFGVLGADVKIIQVVDESAAIAEIHCPMQEPVTFLLAGKTSDLTDGMTYEIGDVCQVTGTTTYKTLLGGSNTVYVVAKMDTKPIFAALEARREQKTEAKK